MDSALFRNSDQFITLANEDSKCAEVGSILLQASRGSRQSHIFLAAALGSAAVAIRRWRAFSEEVEWHLLAPTFLAHLIFCTD